MVVQEKPEIFISQKDNFAANFGDVLRSSAIFWARCRDGMTTTVTFSNYWLYKNRTEVAVVVNLRDAEGRLHARRHVAFDDSEMCNFTPPDGFEGSVEVEVFANRNIRIPYAAIMAVYETREAVSMVHSYARAYSQHEIEDGRTICKGEEACWTVRAGDGLVSFAAFHNGSLEQRAQTAQLRIRNHRGKCARSMSNSTGSRPSPRSPLCPPIL